MIKRLKLKNFLSYRETEVEFNEFNVIIGANASGKTNLIRALIVLKELSIGGFQSLEDFDGFMEGVFNKNSNEKESLIIEAIVQNQIELDLTNGSKLKIEEHHYTLELAFGRGVVSEKYLVKIQDKVRLLKILERDAIKAKYTNEYDDHFSKEIAVEVDKKLFDVIRYQTLAGKALSGLLSVFNQAYSSFFWSYSLASDQLIRPYFSRNQKVLAMNGHNLSGVLQYYKEHNPIVIESINEILRRNIPHFRSVDTKPLGLSKNFYFVVSEDDGKEYVLDELSQGTDLFIGLVTAMVTSQFIEMPEKMKGIIVIEEPEKNLHPQLMEELVTVAKTLTDRFQVIITTHSTDLVSHLNIDDLILLDKTKQGTRLQRVKKSKELSSYLEEFSLDQIWMNSDLGGGTING